MPSFHGISLKRVLWEKQIIPESPRKRTFQLKELKSHQEPSEVISSPAQHPPPPVKRDAFKCLLPSLASSIEPQSPKEGASESTSWEVAVAEAALFSIFMKALTWCQTTSSGFKPSFFQVQGRAGLVSMCMASSRHSGCWA